jgi:5-methyltetrahydropteroyltriglutamate--homocysteine methyltransferase
MAASAPPTRADVVGSLLRPQHLVEARDRFERGALGVVELKRIEDRAVDQQIALQEGAGLRIVTDGEMRRASWLAPLTETVDGFEHVPGELRRWYSPAGVVDEELPFVVTGRLRQRRSLVAEEYAYARARARVPVKVTLPSPLALCLRWSPRASTAAYADAFAMVADAVDIVRGNIRELAEQGCTHVQIDAPELATLVQAETRDWYAQRGMPAERMLTEGIDLINAVADVPGVRYGIHLCRGNGAGKWMAEGGYDYIARALFERATAFDAYLLEYDDERSGGFEPLEHVPDDKVVVLGLVSSKRVELEDPATVAARIEAASRYVPLERLALSTQCGFASAAAGNPIGAHVEEAKLRLVVDVAERVWG